MSSSMSSSLVGAGTVTREQHQNDAVEPELAGDRWQRVLESAPLRYRAKWLHIGLARDAKAAAARGDWKFATELMKRALKAQEFERREMVIEATQRIAKSRSHSRETRGLRPARRSRARRRGAGRPKASATRSSAKSGDSGDDSSDSEPPAVLDLWRWADPASWRSLVASVQSRDFELEIARERTQGVSR